MLVGPSDESLEYMSKCHIKDQEWCDDALTAAKMDLICRVYQVTTSECGSSSFVLSPISQMQDMDVR